jgi:VanZ family protein
MQKSRITGIAGRFILSSAWALLILAACIVPANKVHRSFLLNVKHIDKYFHFIMYFGFSVILYIDLHKYRRLLKNRYLASLYIFAISLAWGIIIELIQYFFVSSREGSILDVLANAGGIIAGLILILTTVKYLQKQ